MHGLNRKKNVTDYYCFFPSLMIFPLGFKWNKPKPGSLASSRKSITPPQLLKNTPEHKEVDDIEVFVQKLFKIKSIVWRLFKKRFQVADAPIGKGLWGVVYKVPTHARARLKAFKKTLTNVVSSDMPLPKSTPLVIKIAKIRPAEKRDSFIQRNVRENACHLKVQRAAPSIVPTLYFAGSTGELYITVMEYIEGQLLFDVVKQYNGRIPKQLYDALHAAVVTMWKIGVVHCDLHYKNIIVQLTPQGLYTVKLLDFGYAVELNTNFIKPYLDKGDIAGAWSVIKVYIDHVQKKRGFSRYNPNANTLAQLKYWMRNGIGK